MSQEWLYRASDAQENVEETRVFVEEFGFICRSAYVDGKRAQMIANVGDVSPGDVIHLYYVAPAGGTALGSFRVVGMNRHPQPELFGKAVTIGLRTVADGPLKDRLEGVKGYAPDPRLGVYCGWPVVPDGRVSPSYRRELFPSRSSLVLH